MTSLHAEYGRLLLEIDRLKREAASLKKRINAHASNGRTWGKYRGVQSAVAKELGVSRSTVKSVMQGRATSARVSSALAGAIKEIDAKPRGKKYGPLSPEQLAECSGGGRYFGCFSRAAKASGLSATSIRKAAMGITKSQAPLRALHAEIARIDALPPSENPQPLTSERLSEFSRGGRYYGCLAQIARKLNSTSANIYSVAKGTARSKRLLVGIHEELARIDAELAAKRGVAL